MSEKRDILGELFKDSGECAPAPDQEKLNELIHVCTDLEPRAQEPKRKKNVAQSKGKRRKEKKKTTHYLNEDVYVGLAEANLAIKSLLPDGEKSRASKSRLVNYAVYKLLQEIEEKGETSPLIQNILGKSK